MSYEIFADYNQGRLFSDHADFQVASNHPVQYLRAFVDTLDLKKLGFPVRTSNTGRPNFSSRLLLKAWLFGYINRITSSRALEAACLENRYLGYLIGWHTPDHSTLNNFWRNNLEAIGKVFKSSVLVADRQGMIGHVIQAVDGTKIQARSSRRTAWNRADLEQKMDLVNKAIVEIQQQIARAEAEAISVEYLPEKLADQESLRAEIRNALEWLDDHQKGDYNNDRKKTHRLEPEADEMISTQGGTRLGYNGQAVADDQHQIIVAADLTNDCHDMHQLNNMAQQARENTGWNSAMTVADAGYHTLDGLYKASLAGHEVLVNNPEQARMQKNPLHSHHFELDQKTLEVTCPRGEKIPYSHHTAKHKNLDDVRVHLCKNRTCPLREQCTTSKKGKEIRISMQHRALYAQLARHKTLEGSYWLSQRKAIIEPVFAHLKMMMGKVRFTFTGMAKAKVQYLMFCTAHNLKKMIIEWQKKIVKKNRDYILE